MIYHYADRPAKTLLLRNYGPSDQWKYSSTTPNPQLTFQPIYIGPHASLIWPRMIYPVDHFHLYLLFLAFFQTERTKISNGWVIIHKRLPLCTNSARVNILLVYHFLASGLPRLFGWCGETWNRRLNNSWDEWWARNPLDFVFRYTALLQVRSMCQCVLDRKVV